MPISDRAARSLGKLIANITGNLRWHGKGAGGATVGAAVYVLNHRGEKVKASHTGSVSDNDGKLAEHYVGPDGHEYVEVNGKTYRYDPNTDGWYNA